jgi:hypothetical protein
MHNLRIVCGLYFSANFNLSATSEQKNLSGIGTVRAFLVLESVHRCSTNKIVTGIMTRRRPWKPP